MPSSRAAAIAENFGRGATDYDRFTGLQRDVAQKLMGFLPRKTVNTILEFGAGTGALTRHIKTLYPQARCTITDISAQMLDENRSRNAAPNIAFKVMNAQVPDQDGPFDLIAGSMVAHWFDNPYAALERLETLLSPGGMLVYSALGPDAFPEWRETLERLNLKSGIITPAEFPGVVMEEKIITDHDCAISFFNAMKRIGANHPRAGYAPLSPAHMREALRLHDRLYGGRFTWHIVYGCLKRA
jgi:malonyl-CoA O-methyltransferase